MKGKNYTIELIRIDEKTTDPDDRKQQEEYMIKRIYEALQNEGLVFRNIAATGPNGGHAAIYYGINADGEILMSDTSMHCDRVGVYKNHKCAWHLYKHVSNHGSALIIYPNPNKEGTAT